MAWLKLTDALLSHRKTRRLLRRGKNCSGLAAFGLHMAALLHCSEYLTDGYVEPEFVAETLDDANARGKQRTELVELLVEGGQWTPKGDGWLIHDYLDHNPSRDEVLARRAKDAERKARGRSSQSHDRPRGQDEDDARSPTEVPAPSDGPVPSRPVPSLNSSGGGDAPEGAEVDPDIVAGIAAGAVHPDVPAVMALLEALPPDKALNLDKGAVNNCLLAHRDGDAIGAAHRVVSWALEGQMRTRSASNALHTIFDKQRTEAEVRAKQVEKAGERPVYPARPGGGPAKNSAAEQAAEIRARGLRGDRDRDERTAA